MPVPHCGGLLHQTPSLADQPLPPLKGERPMKHLLRLAALLAAVAAAAAVLCRLLNEKGRGSYVTLFDDDEAA